MVTKANLEELERDLALIAEAAQGVSNRIERLSTEIEEMRDWSHYLQRVTLLKLKTTIEAMKSSIPGTDPAIRLKSVSVVP